MIQSVDLIIFTCMVIVCICIVISIAKEVKANKQLSNVDKEYTKLSNEYHENLAKVANMIRLNESQHTLGLSTDEEYTKQGKKLIQITKEIQLDFENKVKKLESKLSRIENNLGNLNETKKDE